MGRNSLHNNKSLTVALSPCMYINYYSYMVTMYMAELVADLFHSWLEQLMLEQLGNSKISLTWSATFSNCSNSKKHCQY